MHETGVELQALRGEDERLTFLAVCDDGTGGALGASSTSASAAARRKCQWRGRGQDCVIAAPGRRTVDPSGCPDDPPGRRRVACCETGWMPAGRSPMAVTCVLKPAAPTWRSQRHGRFAHWRINRCGTIHGGPRVKDPNGKMVCGSSSHL